ncbi:uncharacterized protein [Choristoneura fumiferana]|uniref:uncharacterized protein n=1 Tax=Choristoneura fumiferana TaxID=7141 RepID=UPI003D155658
MNNNDKICAACNKTIVGSQFMKCSKCCFLHHFVCVNIPEQRKVSDNFKSEWICPDCKSKQPKTGNSNTPVRSSAPGDDANQNVTFRAQNRKTAAAAGSSVTAAPGVGSGWSEAISSLTSEIRMLRVDMNEVKNNLKNLTTCIAQCSARLDSQESALKTSEAKIRALEERQRETAVLSERIVILEDQLNAQAQYSMRNEIEIMGINENRSENLHHIALVAAKKIGIDLVELEIDSVKRVGPRSKSERQAESQPRPIVLKFTRHSKRVDFLSCAKTRRNLSSADIEVAGPSRKLFFNERLTKENRKLFREARQQKNNLGFKHCWTKDGHILMREKDGSTVFSIQRDADLAELVSTRSPVLDSSVITSEKAAGRSGEDAAE